MMLWSSEWEIHSEDTGRGFSRALDLHDHSTDRDPGSAHEVLYGSFLNCATYHILIVLIDIA